MYSNKRPQETPHKLTPRKITKPNNTMELELISKPVNPLLQELGLSNLNDQLTYEQYYQSFKPKFVFPEHPKDIPTLDSNASNLTKLSLKVDKFLESEWRFQDSEFPHLWKV